MMSSTEIMINAGHNCAFYLDITIGSLVMFPRLSTSNYTIEATLFETIIPFLCSSSVFFTNNDLAIVLEVDAAGNYCKIMKTNGQTGWFYINQLTTVH